MCCASSSTSRPILRRNPLGQVPVLVHDGRVITETSLMIQYLDAAFPEPPLTPTSAADRYHMHVWLRTSDDYFGPPLAVLGWHLSGAAGNLTAAQVKKALAGIARLPRNGRPYGMRRWRIRIPQTNSMRRAHSRPVRAAHRDGAACERLARRRRLQPRGHRHLSDGASAGAIASRGTQRKRNARRERLAAPDRRTSGRAQGAAHGAQP